MAASAAAEPGTGFAVTVPDLAATSTAFLRQHDAAAAAADAASAALSGTAGMAGDDEVLAVCRGHYDAVAAITWLAVGATAGSMHGIAVLLVDTADDYLAAEHRSTPGAVGSPERLARPAPARRLPAGPPACTGPCPDPIPADVPADLWPRADPARLRTAADGWNALAGTLDPAAYRADSAFRTLLAHNRGAAFSAMAEYWRRRFAPDAFDPLYNASSRTSRIVGQVCRALADLVEQTRRDVANAAVDAAHDTAGAEILARLPPVAAPLTGAKLVGILAPVLVTGGYIAMARGNYLQGVHELTERLGPDLEDRLRRALSIELPRGGDPRTDHETGTRAHDVQEVLGAGLRGSLWNAMEGPHPGPDQIRLADDDLIHILDGDARGGGHRSGAGKPGKTEFPPWWDDNRIIDAVVGVARDPVYRNRAVEEGGPNLTLEGTRDGVLIRVHLSPDGSIASAHPLEGVGVVTNPQR